MNKFIKALISTIIVFILIIGIVYAVCKAPIISLIVLAVLTFCVAVYAIYELL